MKRGFAALLVAALALACRDGSLGGPGLPVRTSLALAPTFATPAGVSAADAPLRIAYVWVKVSRLPSGDSVAAKVEAFAADRDEQAFTLTFATAPEDTSFAVRVVAMDAARDTIFASSLTDVKPDAPATPVTLRYVGRDTVVASVAVEPRDTVVNQGQTAALRAVARRGDGATTAALINWLSRDPSRATIGGVTGVLTPGSASGPVWIVAWTWNGRQDSTRVTVLRGVANVAVAPDSLFVALGRAARVAASPLDAAGAVVEGTPVSWSSADAAVATVDGAGLVTGRALGRVLLTATAGGRTRAVPVRVVPVPVARVVVAERAAGTFALESVRLTAAMFDDAGAALIGRAVAWRSLDDGIARVASDGSVTGVAAGTARIVAESEGVSDTVEVVVGPARIASLVMPDTASVARDDTVRVRARLRDLAGGDLARPVVYGVTDSTAASVDADGLVRARKANVSLLLLAAAGGHADTTVLRTLPKPVDTVVVAPAASVTLAVGRTLALSATALDRAGVPTFDLPVTWTSAAPGVVTVAADGTLRGVGAGAANVVATSGGRQTTVRVGVTEVPVATVGVEPRRATVVLGDSLQLYVGGRDSTGRLVLVYPSAAVAWTSLEPAVAGVSAAGLVRALAAGTARVVAAGEGRADTATVTIVPAALAFSASGVSLAPGQSATALLSLTRPSAAPLAVTLASGDGSVASVPATVTVPAGASGVPVTLTGVGNGVATIIATAAGYAPATVSATVAAGTLTLGGWPTSLARGDSALVTVYLADGAGQTRTAAVPVALALGAPGAVDFSNGSGTITSVTVRAGATGASFYVVARSSGAWSTTITAAGYAPLPTPTVTVP